MIEMLFKIDTIKRKIIAILVFCIVILLSIFSMYNYSNKLSDAMYELNSLADRQSKRLEQNLMIPLWEIDNKWVKEIILTEMEDKNIFAIIVYGEGDLREGFSRDKNWNAIPLLDINVSDDVYREINIFRDGEIIGKADLYLTSRFVRADSIRNLMSEVSISLVVSGLVLYFLIYMLNRIVIRPLQSFSENIRAVSQGDYTKSLQIQQKDEIGKLAETFILMQKNIRQRETERDNANKQLAQKKEELQIANDHLKVELVEREKAEVALAKSERQYRGLVESLKDEYFFYAHDTDGIFTYVSPSIENILGYTSEEFKVHYLQYLTDNPVNDKVEELTQMAMKGIAQPGYELEIFHKDGSKRTLMVKENPGVDENGVVVSIDGIAHDVSSLKHAEKELSGIRHYLQNIIDSMPSVLVGVDNEGIITQWNIEAERVVGVSSSVAKGQLLDKLMPFLSSEMERVRKAINEETSQKVERKRYQEDNQDVYSDIMIYPLVQNNVVGAVIRIDDVTERVRMEQMMAQTEKMMSVGGLAAGMAHELNNPLGGVLQGIQNVNRRFSTDLPKNVQVAESIGLDLKIVHDYMEQREITGFMDAIKEAGERASKIVTNMLAFSRRPNAMQVEPVDLAALIDGTLQLAAVDYDLKKNYDFRSIDIAKEYQAQRTSVYCISSEIQQVLLNILRNAAQALRFRDDLEQKPRITVRLRYESGMAHIEIEDNGPGLKEGSDRRIFEPFFTTRPPGEGTGLGLSVSYFIIVDEHGGKLQVESPPGKGAKFIISLPIGRAGKK